MSSSAAFTVSKRRLVLFLVLVALIAAASFGLPSCMHYRVTAIEGDGVLEHRATRHVLLWGIIEEPIYVAANAANPEHRCSSNALQEVTVSTNFGYALITVLTLGIWAPADVEWNCHAGESRSGDFGDLLGEGDGDAE
jgi:hypothetical protein